MRGGGPLYAAVGGSLRVRVDSGDVVLRVRGHHGAYSGRHRPRGCRGSNGVDDFGGDRVTEENRSGPGRTIAIALVGAVALALVP